MKLDFRIDFGYQTLYQRKLYHPVFIWDGSLSCENGSITEVYSLEYPYFIYGIGHSAKETPLASPEWKLKTKRNLAGFRFVAEANDDAVFTLETASGDLTFSASELMEKKRISLPVGPKYVACFITVTMTGYMWFMPEAKPGETVFNAGELGLPTHNHARMELAWLKSGESVSFDFNVPESNSDYSETIIHLVAMGVPPEFDPVKEDQVNAMVPFEVYCDGELVMKFDRYYRFHDLNMQILEDSWICVSAAPGKHTFSLKQLSTEISVGISQIKVHEDHFVHGQLKIPAWSLKGEALVGKVFAIRDDSITVKVGNAEYIVDCRMGWNEFDFAVNEAGVVKFKTATSETEIEVFDCKEEENPIKVGYDMTTVPHDETGFMDGLLDYTQSTRLGNYVVFRSHQGDIEDRVLEKWGEYCRSHGIYVSACNNYLSGALARGAADMFSDCGRHEYPGLVYALDPTAPYASEDMKSASEKYMDFLKVEIDKAHTVSDVAAFGDASGGIRYSFLAGADFVRAETMVGHTMTLLSQARPAAEALGRGKWGVHIAIQHNYFPYREEHLNQYFLCMMQPWVMGADTIYEEDCLFNLFKEERQAWDDRLTRGKRDMTRSFFKFAKTHPRQGKCVRNIAFLEGRYAAPFNGFICDYEQDPHYSVWGAFGNKAAEWGHGQPEKCRHILDVLMPGAAALPFLQKHDKRRFFFSGTPYGDFDCVPVEASAKYLEGYKLIFNLGWNTMIPEDYEKLKDYVSKGGTLLTGLPQFSTHLKRDFLSDMKDLALINGGDLSELCGVKVSRGDTVYCGQWSCKGRTGLYEPELCAMPSENPCEDGVPLLADVELCGAEVVAWDSYTGKPLLVKHKYGEGEVYTFTMWAYPGHEQFMRFSATWVRELARRALPDVYVEDATGEVFWTRWVDGDNTRIMMLNTDWTVSGNVKEVTLHAGDESHRLAVKESTLVVADVKNGEVAVSEFTL